MLSAARVGAREGYLTFDPHVRGQLWPPSLGVHRDMAHVCKPSGGTFGLDFIGYYLLSSSITFKVQVSGVSQSGYSAPHHRILPHHTVPLRSAQFRSGLLSH